MQHNFMTVPEHLSTMSVQEKKDLNDELVKAVVKSVLTFVAVKVALTISLRLVVKALDKRN